MALRFAFYPKSAAYRRNSVKRMERGVYKTKILRRSLLKLSLKSMRMVSRSLKIESDKS